jgi:hypothetical protein
MADMRVVSSRSASLTESMPPSPHASTAHHSGMSVLPIILHPAATTTAPFQTLVDVALRVIVPLLHTC